VQASRLLTIQMLLQSRGRLSARVLAEELQVSIRTLHRDVDQLGAAGVPIYAERGRSGGFALLDGWKTSLTGLTKSESQAVLLSGLAAPAAQLGLGAEVKAAQLKLLSAVPTAWREHARIVSDRLHLDPVDWYHEQEPVPHLSLAAEAVWKDLRLAMRYESWKHTSKRSVSPLGLVLKGGTWYLVAMLRDEPRTFRVANILSARLLDEPARRPKSFDLAAYWADSIRRFERDLYTVEATVLATDAGLKGLSGLGAAAARAVAAAAGPGSTAERVKLRIPIESIEHATGQLLRLAPDVEVLAPAALRAAMIKRLKKIVRLYGTPAP
jgi:predicted DNA-binding transcriptional regulator YafY